MINLQRTTNGITITFGTPINIGAACLIGDNKDLVLVNNKPFCSVYRPTNSGIYAIRA